MIGQLGRMVSRTEAEGMSRWKFDTKWVGALDKVRNPTSTKLYSYDAFGRVTSSQTRVNGQSLSIQTSYTNIGQVDRTTYPSGLVVKHQYHPNQGYLQAVNDANGAMIWQINQQDIFGNITQESFANGISTTYSYDKVRGVLTGIDSGAGKQQWSYAYDAVGNMLFRQDHVMGWTEQF